MSDPMVSVIIPTIQPRVAAGWLDRCLAAYENTLDVTWEAIVIHDKPTCGIAWNEGIGQARGRYIHLTADDIEPLAGWAPPAMEAVDRGVLPAPRILNTDGTLQSCGTGDREAEEGSEATLTRVPFMSREQCDLIGRIIPVHYQTDQWVSHVAREKGIITVVTRAYLLIHHFAPEGRLDDRLADDVRYYHRKGGT